MKVLIFFLFFLLTSFDIHSLNICTKNSAEHVFMQYSSMISGVLWSLLFYFDKKFICKIVKHKWLQKHFWNYALQIIGYFIIKKKPLVWTFLLYKYSTNTNFSKFFLLTLTLFRHKIYSSYVASNLIIQQNYNYSRKNFVFKFLKNYILHTTFYTRDENLT